MSHVFDVSRDQVRRDCVSVDTECLCIDCHRTCARLSKQRCLLVFEVSFELRHSREQTKGRLAITGQKGRRCHAATDKSAVYDVRRWHICFLPDPCVCECPFLSAPALLYWTSTSAPSGSCERVTWNRQLPPHTEQGAGEELTGVIEESSCESRDGAEQASLRSPASSALTRSLLKLGSRRSQVLSLCAVVLLVFDSCRPYPICQQTRQQPFLSG